jgi:guanylate kinase
VGKGTVVRRLLELRPDLVLSVSYTTRSPRAGEVDGRDYHFVSPDEFDRFIREGALLEWADLYGHHRSGTPRGPVEHAREAGRDVILEIDVQGARNIRRSEPDAVLVFLAPPSPQELERRLRDRRTEGERAMARRLAAARDEMGQEAVFDHVVVNDDVDRAAREVAAIIDGSRIAS